MYRSVLLKNIKAGPEDDLEEGVFTAYASVFDNVDAWGDVMRKGSFERTLKEWAERAGEIPLLWGHDTHDPFSNLGFVRSAEEDDHGLLTENVLDLENPKATQVYRMLKGRRIDQMSFAFDYVKSGRGKLDGEDINEVFDVDLHEVSVVPYGANSRTEVLMVKDASRLLLRDVKSGRVLSAKNESELRAAYDSIGRVLSALTPEDEGSKASVTEPSKDDDPAAGKSDEATPLTTARLRLSLDLATAESEMLI